MVKSSAAEAQGSIPAKHVAAVVAGNALEFYDLYVYSFFAVYIGRAFFPSKDRTASLLASLATFGLGFVMRPVGGWVFGRFADRAGRRRAMVLCFWLTGIALAGMALTPSYAMIGVVAPVLVILFRLLHGFALGGEVGPTTAFLIEAAPPERRGFYGSFQIWTQSLAVLLSGILGLVLSNALDDRQLQHFGRRIAFLLGVAIVPVGLAMRRSLPETLRPNRADEQAAVGGEAWIGFLGLLLLSASVGSYVITYMTTYTIFTLHMKSNIAFAATLVAGAVGVCLNLVTGAASDRLGRKPIMLVSSILLLLAIIPAFRLMAHYRSAAVLLGAVAVLSILRGVNAPLNIVWLVESLPPSSRSTGFAFVYALSISMFGGTTQYVVAWLTKLTGNPVAPAWYWTAAMVLSVAATFMLRESAPRKLPAAIAALPELSEAQ